MFSPCLNRVEICFSFIKLISQQQFSPQPPCSRAWANLNPAFGKQFLSFLDWEKPLFVFNDKKRLIKAIPQGIKKGKLQCAIHLCCPVPPEDTLQSWGLCCCSPCPHVLHTPKQSQQPQEVLQFPQQQPANICILPPELLQA